MARVCGSGFLRFFEYDTPQMLHTNSKWIGIMFRILQLFIFVFIFAYYIGYKQGYQDVANTIVSSTRLTGLESKYAPIDTWDFPIYLTLKENEKFFIPTFAVEYTQLKSVCPEDRDVIGAVCDPDKNRCVANMTFPYGNGRTTGRCVSSKRTVYTMPLYPQQDYYACEIAGWCTTEKQLHSVAKMLNVKDMRLIVENEIYFPRFTNERKLTNYNNSIVPCLKDDHHHSAEHPLCPVFSVGDLLKRGSTVDGQLIYTYQQLIDSGAIFLIHIMWDCNFDLAPMDDCSVKYNVRRLDSPLDFTSKTADLKFGQSAFNGRKMLYFYGIRFVTLVEGTARKFSLFSFLTRVGASVGLFAIASLFCEVLIIFSCCTRERQVRNFKFLSMEEHPKRRASIQPNYNV